MFSFVWTPVTRSKRGNGSRARHQTPLVSHKFLGDDRGVWSFAIPSWIGIGGRSDGYRQEVGDVADTSLGGIAKFRPRLAFSDTEYRPYASTGLPGLDIGEFKTTILLACRFLMSLALHGAAAFYVNRYLYHSQSDDLIHVRNESLHYMYANAI